MKEKKEIYFKFDNETIIFKEMTEYIGIINRVQERDPELIKHGISKKYQLRIENPASLNLLIILSDDKEELTKEKDIFFEWVKYWKEIK